MNWCGNTECELEIKEKTGASTRCTPLGSKVPKGGRSADSKLRNKGVCPHCGRDVDRVIYFSRSY
jgi:prolyl-tRNA synthetase